MGFFYFLGQKKFYIHFLIAIVVAFIFLWGVLISLDAFTRHGEVYIVPDFKGQTLDSIREQDYDDFFDLIVIDSVYDRVLPKGSVIMQHPLSGSRVKQDRHIYLTIVSEMPEFVEMPNLKNLSLRQALVTLESLNLEVGQLIYVEYFARNAVVEQEINGEPVEPETKIAVGSTVDLQVGEGDNKTSVPVPVLIAKKRKGAIKELHYAYLNLGKEYYLDGNDTTHARVYKTKPRPLQDQMLDLGEKVDIWYRSDENFDFDNYLKQFVLDSLTVDTLIRQNIIKEND
jgi:eukaryotic-like serine/threonine-protein kinase